MRSTQIHRWFAGLSAAVLGFVATGCGSSSAPPPPVSPDPVPPEARMPANFTGPSRGRLAAGEPMPVLRCVGWTNGEPRPYAPDGPKLHVVDVWSRWCPECDRFAPKLAELKTKYEDRGVQFVSVTDMPKGMVENYNRVGGIDWPSGYGLAIELIDELGAVNKGMAAQTRGYNIGPTIYVVGSDGKVVGSDESGRWRQQRPADIVAKLEKLIDGALEEKKAK
jgi:thiol-disulfide isomerase/thioredoxin